MEINGLPTGALFTSIVTSIEIIVKQHAQVFLTIIGVNNKKERPGLASDVIEAGEVWTKTYGRPKRLP